MVAVRVLLQIVILVMFVLAFDVALREPMTADHIGNIIGVALFGIGLFTATFFIGDEKEKQVNVLGERVNPKAFGVMSMVVGATMLFGAWHALSGRPVGESPGVAGPRGAAIIELLFQIPVLLVPAGLALVWYGAKLFRARQPNNRMHRTRAKAARAGDAER